MADEHKLIKEERLVNDLATKKIYNYVDTQRGIDKLCKEVFKKKMKRSTIPLDMTVAKNTKT